LVKVFLQILQTTIVFVDPICCSFPALAAEAFPIFFLFPPGASSAALFLDVFSTSTKWA
jgi:hypothetical protein